MPDEYDDCGKDIPHVFQPIPEASDHTFTVYECQRCGDMNEVWR